MEKFDKRCEAIADQYGYEGELSAGIDVLSDLIVGLAKKGSGQRAKAIEELAELILALTKLDTVSAEGEEEWDSEAIKERVEKMASIKEEMADVWIMLNQIAYILRIPGQELDWWIDAKLWRQECRIKCEAVGLEETDCSWR